jgi:archaetidylinositol phosphate synthase
MAQERLQRHNDGWLGPLERPTLLWLAARMPAWMTPDGLTVIGLVGALMSFAGFALAAQNLHALWLASAGLIVNWFGDSLDGNLARYRKIERPRYGYFLDNSVDVIQQFIITFGIGLSGLIRWELCFLALSAFFMMSILTLLRTQVSRVYQLTYGGIGPTEMRAFGIVLNAVIVFVPPQSLDGLGLPMTYPNLLSLAWSLATLATFALSFIRQLRELAIEDPPR